MFLSLSLQQQREQRERDFCSSEEEKDEEDKLRGETTEPRGEEAEEGWCDEKEDGCVGVVEYEPPRVDE